jgi:hypothetical protein
MKRLLRVAIMAVMVFFCVSALADELITLRIDWQQASAEEFLEYGYEIEWAIGMTDMPGVYDESRIIETIPYEAMPSGVYSKYINVYLPENTTVIRYFRIFTYYPDRIKQSNELKCVINTDSHPAAVLISVVRVD